MTEEEYKKAKIGFEKLKEIDLKQEDSYNEIYKLLIDYIPIFVPWLLISNRTVFFRSRLNEECPFCFRSDISYNPNSTKFGRANHLRQSIFYASYEIETSLFETSIVTRKMIKGSKERITLGKWIVKQPFYIGAIINDPELLNKNEEIRKLYQNFLSLNPSFTDTRIQEIMKLISDIFAEKIIEGEEYRYKLSAAFFNRILEVSFKKGIPIFGLLYPSVEYEKKDLNIAILAYVVDDCLTLQNIFTYEVSLNEINGLIVPIGSCDIQSYRMVNIKRPVPNERAADNAGA